MDDEIRSDEPSNDSLFKITNLTGEPYRKVKDSVFKQLFADPKYLLQLYQTLHPEDQEATSKDLELVTLETVITKDINNDLGFMVGSNLVILVEAQSTWSVNIILRCLLYLARTYQNYVEIKKKSLYGSKKVDIPYAELYVIYTGNSKIDKREISLAEEFFPNQPVTIDLKVKVITEGESQGIINQYIVFSKVIDEQIRLYGRTVKAVEEAVRICKDRNILKEFLERHEKEAIDIMVQLYSQEEVVRDWGVSQYTEGMEKGVEKGLKESAVKMHASGMSVSDISRILDYSESAVREWLGLPMA